MFTSNSEFEMMGWTWLHVHWIFGALLLFGFVAGLLWLYKHGTKPVFLSVVTWSLILGTIGLLLTAPMAGRGFSAMMNDDDWDMMGQTWEDLEDEYGRDIERKDMMDYMSDEMREYFENQGDVTSQSSEPENL